MLEIHFFEKKDVRIVSIKLKYLLAISCCMILANIYYAQPIISDISASIGFSLAFAGIIITTTQIGYCLGVFFLVPLVDFIDNRKLITLTTFCNGFSLLIAGHSTDATSFLIATLFVGFFSSCVQIIIPFTVGIADVRERGQITGLVMSGAILGLVLARPVSSFLTSAISWQFVYYLAAFFMFMLTPMLYRFLPVKTVTNNGISYKSIFKSMWNMFFFVRGLQARLFIMALVFATFTMFWATAPILLQDRLGFSHTDVAFFSLVSLITPVCAIIAGRLVDRGYGVKMTFVRIIMITLGYLSTPTLGIYSGAFILMVFLVDPGVNMVNMVIQQAVLAGLPEARGRVNALCIAFTFIGGAIGPWIYSHYSWPIVVFTGIVLMTATLIINTFLLRKSLFKNLY